MNPAAEAAVKGVEPMERTASLFAGILGPAFTVKEVNVVRWAIVILTAAISGLRGLYLSFQNGGFQRVFQGDFIYFYSFGRILNEYPAARLYDYALHMKICDMLQPLTAGKWGHSPYPPTVAMLFQPLAAMNFFAAYMLWLAISFGLYSAGLFIVTRRFFPSDPFRRALVFCFGLCFAPFLGWIMEGGQISTLGFFAMALAFCLEDRDRPLLSGLALSLCTYKPTLLLLLLPMLLVTRRYRTLLGFAVGASVLAVLPIPFHGIGVWSGYLNTVLNFSNTVRTPSFYVDLGAFASLIPGGRSWPGRFVFVGLAAWAGFSLVCVWWRSIGAQRSTRTLVWATTLTWTLVLNVYVPLYDVILVVIGIVATVAALNNLPDKRLHRRLTIVWLLIFAFAGITQGLAQRAGFQIITVPLVLLGILQFSALRKIDPPTATTGPRDHASALVAVPN